MRDHIWENNNRYRLVPVEGQSEQFDLIPVPGTVYEVGTPINKATLLKDSTYEKYSSVDPKAPLPNDATPDYVLNQLSSAYANSVKTILTGGKMISLGNATSGTKIETKSEFSLFDTISFDATKRCKLDKTEDGSPTLYCDRVYIPKGVKSVLVSVRYKKTYTGSMTVYKNGVAVQSLLLESGSNIINYVAHGHARAIIETTGSGSEYIQLYMTTTNATYTDSSIQCIELMVEPLTF